MEMVANELTYLGIYFLHGAARRSRERQDKENFLLI